MTLKECDTLPYVIFRGSPYKEPYDRVVEVFIPGRKKWKDFSFGGVMALLRTARGHLALQSYSTIVRIYFNVFNEGHRKGVITLWDNSRTTRRHMRLAQEHFPALRNFFAHEKLIYAPTWYDKEARNRWWRRKKDGSPYHKIVEDNVTSFFVGGEDPFNPVCWDKYEPIRVDSCAICFGQRELLENGVRLERFDNRRTGQVFWRVYDVNALSHLRYRKYAGFTNVDEDELITFSDRKDALAFALAPYKARLTMLQLYKEVPDHDEI